jgi:hypothetical protein
VPDQIAEGNEWSRNVEVRSANLSIAKQAYGIAKGKNWNDRPELLAAPTPLAVFQFTAKVGASPSGINRTSTHLRQPECRLKAAIIAKTVTTMTAIQPAINKYCTGPCPKSETRSAPSRAAH